MQMVIRNTGTGRHCEDRIHIGIRTADIDVIIRTRSRKDPSKVRTPASRRHMLADMSRPGEGADIGRKGQIFGIRHGVVEFERPFAAMQRVGKGHHRCHTNAATHQEAASGAAAEFEMVDRARDKDTTPLGKDAVHQQRAATPLILAKHRHLIGIAVRRITRHGILPHHPRRDEHIDMPACRPFRKR